MGSIVVRNMRFFLQRRVHGSERRIVLHSEVPVGVDTGDEADVVVSVGETDLRSNVVTKRVLHRLHAHALCPVPLPYVDTLVWISVSKRY